jgi:hypothetical protein
MEVNGYEIKLPMLAAFPQFFDLADSPKKLIGELIKVSVYKDGALVGDSIPLEEVLPLMNAISEKLFPKA